MSKAKGAESIAVLKKRSRYLRFLAFRLVELEVLKVFGPAGVV
jgi:hypothetical protein